MRFSAGTLLFVMFANGCVVVVLCSVFMDPRASLRKLQVVQKLAIEVMRPRDNTSRTPHIPHTTVSEAPIPVVLIRSGVDTQPEVVVNKCTQKILARVRFPQQIPFIDKVYGINAIFVIHYKPLVHRKSEMEHRVKTVFNSSPIFIDDLDKNELSATDIACVSNRHAQQKFIKRSTKKGEDSLTLKHMAILNFMVERNLTNVLVLEDDARFFQVDWRSPSSQWQTLLQELPPDYDLVMLSAYDGWAKRGLQIRKHLWLAQQGRVSSAYLVSRKGALNMLRTLPIVAPFDVQIDYAGSTGLPKNLPSPVVKDIKILWAEPPLSDQYDSSGVKRSVWAD